MDVTGTRRISTEGEHKIVTLQDILEAFGAPLNEEQAWALCYQCGRFLCEDNKISDGVVWNFQLDNADGVLLSEEGNVRISGSAPENTECTTTRQAENDLIKSLGRVIYSALDYGLSAEEERELSLPLEELIEFMTVHEEGVAHDDGGNTNDNNNVAGRNEACDSLNVDEGIVDEQEWDDEDEDGGGGGGRDGVDGMNRLSGKTKDTGSDGRTEGNIEDKSKSSQRIPQLMKLCSRHIPQPAEAPLHYQAVCRAVYAEYQDLASFLRRISGSKEILQTLSDRRGDDTDGHVEDLQPRQWAKIWLNVVRDLRNGVKLKKLTEHARPLAPIEYALTPYEMLMDDIRSRRYSLNKVMVDGKIPPKLRKEAHDIVLDFIRSRPPLKPVPKEKLRQEPLRDDSFHETLMKAIRSQPELKPVPIEEKPDPAPIATSMTQKMRLGSVFSDGSEDDLSQVSLDLDLSPQRKVLKAEFSLDWSEEESESESHESDSYSMPRSSWNTVRDVVSAAFTLARGDTTKNTGKNNNGGDNVRGSQRRKRRDNVKDDDTPPAERRRNRDNHRNNRDNVEEGEEADEENANDILERAIQKILDDNIEGQHTEQGIFLDISRPVVQDTRSSTPKTLTSRSSLSSFDEIRSEEIPLESPRRHSVGPCQSYKVASKMYREEDCLSLTVEEVIHIRSVLVKAEIENLQVDKKLYKAVLQDKVCFSCKKKFTLFKKKFGCRLCKKLICKECCVKMFIPKEEFLHIPIDSLSPSHPASPKKSPLSSPLRQRSISDPPTPFLVSTPKRDRRQQNLHVWRKPTPVENVCCECCNFLKKARTGPAPKPFGGASMPTPHFKLSSAPQLQKMNSISS